MKKIGIIANLNKPAAAGLVPKLREWIEKKGHMAADNSREPADAVVKDTDLILCLGGDGTLLSASRLKEVPAPVLGVNLGKLGFLTEVRQEEVFDDLQLFLEGKSQFEERLMLAGTASSSKHKKENRYLALNDIVISREGLSRMLHLEIRVSGEKLTSFPGDGVIIASPTGSTAYSLSAGGAVVHPKLEALLITPICPHASALRPLVVSASEKIEVRIHIAKGAGKALLTADGQENLEIDDSYTIEVVRAPRPLKLVKSSRRSYFATLRENFKFPA